MKGNSVSLSMVPQTLSFSYYQCIATFQPLQQLQQRERGSSMSLKLAGALPLWQVIAAVRRRYMEMPLIVMGIWNVVLDVVHSLSSGQQQPQREWIILSWCDLIWTKWLSCFHTVSRIGLLLILCIGGFLLKVCSSNICFCRHWSFKILIKIISSCQLLCIKIEYSDRLGKSANSCSWQTSM